MPDFVISNTSPLLYLHQLHQLTLLHEIYGKIIVPEAVVAELDVGQKQGEDVPSIDAFGWMEVRQIKALNVIDLIADLGSGEA